MKIIFIGCVKSSYAFLKCVLGLSQAEVVGIITKENSSFNADFYSLKEVASEHHISCFIADQHTELEMLQWCKFLSADIIYCFGWSQLLKNDILNSTKLGVVGYHPAKLPKNRGRHPIIWALALGLDRTASTFFFMDEGADSGDILSQVDVKIDSNDDAATLYEKLVHVALDQIEEFTTLLENNDCRRIQQDHMQANYWRRRGKKDGEIDWRMPAEGIYNLVRALTFPYIGAHFQYKGKEIKVWQVQILNERIQYKNLEPGRIIDIHKNSVDIQCGVGVIRLLKYERDKDFIKGECLM